MSVPFTIPWQVLRLQVDEMASRYGGLLQIYWISSHRQPTRGGPPALGLGEGLTTPHWKKKNSLLQNITQDLRFGWILWNNLGNRKFVWDNGTWNVRSLERTDSLKTVESEMTKYNLDIVTVQEVRWDKGGSQPVRWLYIFPWKWEC